VTIVNAMPAPEHLEVRLVGDLDIANNFSLDLVLRGAVDAGVSGVVAEMAKVTFMDCSTVRVLERAARRLEAHGGRLVVARPSPRVRRVLDLTGYAQVWPVTNDLGQAVELVRAPDVPTDPREQQSSR